MKMIKSFAFLFMASALFGTAAFANDGTTPDEQKKQLRSEILKHVQGLDLGEIDGLAEATLSFMVTSKNEIVVLYVESENRTLDRMLKSRLNYKKVKSDAKRNQKYHIDLKFKNRD